MHIPTHEAIFESIIERVLIQQERYIRRTPADYDRALCLDPQIVVCFLPTSQPQTWTRYLKQYPKDAAERLPRRLAEQIDRRGTPYTFRSGFKDSGCQFHLAYFRPNTALNPEEQERYKGNLFSIIRQLRYRPEGEPSQPEVDLTLFLNELPIFTAELKNQFTGQNVLHAIGQYRRDCPSHEPLFKCDRCLAHFAVDDQLVYLAPEFRDEATFFLPFNRGHNQGAGNPTPPPTSGRFATSYLWEALWTRDSVLDLIQRFVHVIDELDDDGNKADRQQLIFPRYHQLRAVRELLHHARQNGPGQRRLIQHSAGSGKTMTISWLAHQLSVLHGDQDQPIFDTVAVVSDRRVIDRQLQVADRAFEKQRGVVETIDGRSEQLRKALQAGKPIVITTLQKFPVISSQVGELPGRRFAVIVDEAHFSQPGATTQHLNRTLRDASLEEAAADEDRDLEDMEDVLAEQMTLRCPLPNVSTFAFTATPKAKTLQLFGTLDAEGKRRPSSLYPMRQAIEEGFVLDVLTNYTTYKSYWRLAKTAADDPQYDRRKAERILIHLVELSDHVIEQKVAIMVEHFAQSVAAKIGGRAKAMIVTRSRLHAFRYKLAQDDYLAQHHYPFGSLVAFSGTVADRGIDYTESGMNTAAAGTRIAETATAAYPLGARALTAETPAVESQRKNERSAQQR